MRELTAILLLFPLLTAAQQDTVVNGESFNHLTRYNDGSMMSLANYKYKKGRPFLKKGKRTDYYENGKKGASGDYRIALKVRIGRDKIQTRIYPPPKNPLIRIYRTSVKMDGWRYWDKEGTELPDYTTYEKLSAGKLVKYDGRYLPPKEAEVLLKEALMSPEDMLCDTLWEIEYAALSEPEIDPEEMGGPIDWNSIYKGGKYLFKKNGVVLMQPASDTARIIVGAWQVEGKLLFILENIPLFDCTIEQISSRKMRWTCLNDLVIHLAATPTPARLQIDADSMMLAYEMQKANLLAEKQRADSTRKATEQHRLDSLANVLDTLRTYFSSGGPRSVAYVKGKKKVLKEIHYYETGEIQSVNDYQQNTYVYTTFDKTGQKIKEHGNGIETEWYPSGKKLWERSDAGQFQWYKNGQMKLRNVKGKPYTEWHPNGIKSKEHGKDATREWYSSGSLRSKKVRSKEGLLSESYWWKNGQMMKACIWKATGTELACWNKDGSILYKGFIEAETGDYMPDHWDLELKDDDTVVKHHIIYKEKEEGMVSIKEIIKQ
ncbi:MAG: hypothetical protein FVQ77_08215 [Cytophagales bacterium]|nr:hypothetical protein [Cytophagales bacterium]